ncbi:MAG TPA: HAD hydrolase family protein [Candidatus Solibacter sp.]|nr:HAD hydrolase family protein [Candidatus Solibacter sp.]
MPKKLSAQARARRIKLLLFDVDGVLTDGKLYFLPERQDADQKNSQQSSQLTAQGSVEFKGFHAHDGVGVSLARVGGLRTGLITRRFSETVALRARDLRLEFVEQGSQDKAVTLNQIAKQAGIDAAEVAFVGDDIVDLSAMRASGLAIAVQNARAEVKKEAHYVTPHAGGEGGLRDAVEFILKAQGKWKQALNDYLAGKDATRGN